MEKNVVSTKLSDSFFLIESGEERIAYSPLDSKAFKVSKEGSIALRDYFFKNSQDTRVKDFLGSNGIGKNSEIFKLMNQEPYTPVNVTLSLTSGCNLRCLYCYASAGENPEIMDFELAKEAIDIVIKKLQEKNSKTLSIIFHGGGESLTVFPLLKKVSEYALEKWNGLTKFLIVTNGTLITREIAVWFKKFGFHVSVSIDGPRDVQDKLRPKANGKGSYEDCLSGMSFLKEQGVKFSMRATITNENIGRIREMLDIAVKYGCSLRVEPVTPTGRGEYSIPKVEPQEFISAYLDAKEYSQKFGIELRSSYDNGFVIRKSYCGGDGRMFCVLPGGLISSCSRVTKIDDFLAEDFLVGKISDGVLYTDEEKVQRLKQLSVENFLECRDCFAKWYCAGGCHNTRLSNGMLMPSEHCQMSKEFLWLQLRHQVGI